MTQEMRERCRKLQTKSKRLSRESDELRGRSAEALRNSFAFRSHRDSSFNPEPYYTQFAGQILR
jgi:hypothetical protein